MKKKNKISFYKSNGKTCSRLSMPLQWLSLLDINENEPEVVIEFTPKEIKIRKAIDKIKSG